MIARHAHRYVFSHREETQIGFYRPRVVNPEEFQLDQEFWKNWHKDESAEEHSLRPPGRVAQI
jgi:hypothetical protein